MGAGGLFVSYNLLGVASVRLTMVWVLGGGLFWSGLWRWGRQAGRAGGRALRPGAPAKPRLRARASEARRGDPAGEDGHAVCTGAR